MKIALAQINQTVGDFKGNHSRIKAAMKAAEAKGAELVVFPELTTCGCYPRDLLLQDRFIRENMDMLDRLAADSGDIGMLVGYVRPNPLGTKLENAAALLAEGEIVSTHVKHRLTTHGPDDEARFFSAGEVGVPVTFKNIRLGVTLCADICDAKTSADPFGRINPAAMLVEQGAEVIINMSAQPFSMNRSKSTIEMLKQCAASHHRPVVYTNVVGGNDEFVFDGGSMALDPLGSVIAAAAPFETDVVVADIEQSGQTADVSLSEVESVFKALTLGMRDYLLKQRISKVVTLLTGDPISMVGCVIAADAVGPENVTAVSLTTDKTLDNVAMAESLAKTLGIHFQTYPLHHWLNNFRSEISHLVTESVVQSPAQSELTDQMGRWVVSQLIARFNDKLFLCNATRTDIVFNALSPVVGSFALFREVPKSLVYEIAHYFQESQGLWSKAFNLNAADLTYRYSVGGDEQTAPLKMVDQIVTRYLKHGYAPEELVAFGFDEGLVQHVVKTVQARSIYRRSLPPGIRIFGTKETRVPISYHWTGFRE